MGISFYNPKLEFALPLKVWNAEEDAVQIVYWVSKPDV